MNVIDTLYTILYELSSIKKIRPEDRLIQDLGLSSIQLVILLIEIEETLHIELNEVDMNPLDLVTVNDVCRMVERYCGDINETR